jgi:hypothetical protein
MWSFSSIVCTVLLGQNFLKVLTLWLTTLVLLNRYKFSCEHAKLDKLHEDHVMTDNSRNPVHVDKYTSIGAGPSYMQSEQPKKNCSVRLASVHG